MDEMKNIKLEEKIPHIDFKIYDPVHDEIVTTSLQEFA